LNAVGWLAVLSPGVVLGLGVAFLTGRSRWLAAATGVVGSWVLALVIDTRRWRRIPTSVGVSDLSRGQAEAVLVRLRSHDVQVSLHEQLDIDSGETLMSFQSTNRFLKAILMEVDAQRRRAED